MELLNRFTVVDDYNLLCKTIPCIDHTLIEIIISDVQPGLRFIKLERISSSDSY